MQEVALGSNPGNMFIVVCRLQGSPTVWSKLILLQCEHLSFSVSHYYTRTHTSSTQDISALLQFTPPHCHRSRMSHRPMRFPTASSTPLCFSVWPGFGCTVMATANIWLIFFFFEVGVTFFQLLYLELPLGFSIIREMDM